MKEAHLRKLEARLRRARPLLEDSDRVTRMLRRVDPALRKGDIHNRVKDLTRLMETDVPELVAAVRELRRQWTEQRRELRASQYDKQE